MDLLSLHLLVFLGVPPDIPSCAWLFLIAFARSLPFLPLQTVLFNLSKNQTLIKAMAAIFQRPEAEPNPKPALTHHLSIQPL